MIISEFSQTTFEITGSPDGKFLKSHFLAFIDFKCHNYYLHYIPLKHIFLSADQYEWINTLNHITHCAVKKHFCAVPSAVFISRSVVLLEIKISKHKILTWRLVWSLYQKKYSDTQAPGKSPLGEATRTWGDFANILVFRSVLICQRKIRMYSQ